MTALDITFSLSWRMEISREGYTTFTLLDPDGRRWGYVVNAPATGWTAHIGSFDSANPAPIDQLIEFLATSSGVAPVRYTTSAADGRDWVTETIAHVWRIASWQVRPDP